MNHAEFQRMAATAVDFGLSPGERAELEMHRRSCAICREAERRLLDDAEALRRLPQVDAPAELRAAIEWHGLNAVEPYRMHRNARWLVLLVAASLLVTLVMGTVVVGGWLREERDRSVIDPDLTASPSASASTASPTLPIASPSPRATATESPTPTAAATLPPPPTLLSGETWATVAVDQLPLRDPVSGGTLGQLPFGQPVYVSSVVESGDQHVYRVVTDGYGIGTVVAGSAVAPSLVRVDDSRLRWSGRVMRPTVSLDPVTDLRIEPAVDISGLLLDSSLFDAGMLGAFNVAWGNAITVYLDLEIRDGRTVAVDSKVAAGMCDGRVELGASGQLSIDFGVIEIHPDEPPQEVKVVLHDAMLGFPHEQASLALPNLGQTLLLSYVGNDGSTCIQVDARGARGSTVIARRVVTTDCLTVLSASSSEIVLVDDDDPDPDFAHRFTVSAGDQIDPAVVAGATLGLRVLADRGWQGPDLVMSLAPSACS